MKIYYHIKQKTPEWFELRKWKITGTKLKTILGLTEKRLPKWVSDQYQLIADKSINEPELTAMEIIQRGNYLEEFARIEYEQRTWFKVKEVWFIECAEWWLWLSPDWIINTWTTKEPLYTRAVEFKCPMGKEYVRNLVEDCIPSKYVAQVYNYFLVIPELETLDFCIYNPDVHSNIPSFHIITVTRQELDKELKKARIELDKFRKSWLETENALFSKYHLDEKIMINPTKYYSVREVSDIIWASDQTVRTWCNKQKLIAKNIGSEKRKIYKIHGEDLMNFLSIK